MLQELAPWMKVMDALSEISFAREGLTDMPIPLITYAPDFVKEGYPAWAYFCCGPRGRYVQREFDTPLTKTRMIGWLFYRTRVRGFLHWGYNYWYRSQTRELIDPYRVADGRPLAGLGLRRHLRRLPRRRRPPRRLPPLGGVRGRPRRTTRFCSRPASTPTTRSSPRSSTTRSSRAASSGCRRARGKVLGRLDRR